MTDFWETLQSAWTWSQDFADSPWFYALIFGIAMVDGFFPVVPGDVTVIVGGVSAGAGDLNILLVVLIGALGAVTGDSISYGIGRFGMHRFPGFAENRREGVAKTSRQIRVRGGPLLVTARFIPGGRTLLTLACGATRQPYKTWFLRWEVAACLIWATYNGVLGFFFGDWFAEKENGETIAFALAFGTAITIIALLELARWLRARDEVIQD